MHVVLLYAAVLAFLFVMLSVRTVLMRRRLGVAIGHGDDKRMLRATRVHSNFAEYVPLALILIYLVEATGGAPVAVHVLGTCLVVGRISHAFGVSQVNEDVRYRVVGMALTFAVLIAAAARLLYVFARQLPA